MKQQSPLPIRAFEHCDQIHDLVHHPQQLLLAKIPLLFEPLRHLFLHRVLMILHQNMVRLGLRAHICGPHEALLHLQDPLALLKLRQFPPQILPIHHLLKQRISLKSGAVLYNGHVPIYLVEIFSEGLALVFDLSLDVLFGRGVAHSYQVSNQVLAAVVIVQQGQQQITMNKLRAMYSNDPCAREVSLQFEQINDLAPLLLLLQRFTSMEKLSLHGNRLRELPQDLSALETVKELDISNNMFSSSDVVEQALTSMPSLIILTINLKSQSDEDRLSKILPNLQLLNGQLVRRQSSARKEKEKDFISKEPVNSLSQQDLETVAGIFDEVRELFRRGEYNLDKQLAIQFDENVENVIHDLTRRLTGESSANFTIQGRIQCAKYALLDLCFIRAIDYVQYSDPVVGKLLVKIHDLNAEVFKEIANLVLSKNVPEKQNSAQANHNTDEIEMLKKQRGHLYEEINELELQNAKYLEVLAGFGMRGSTTSKSKFEGFATFNGFASKSPLKNSTHALPNHQVYPQLYPQGSANKSPSKGTLRSGKSQKQLVSSQSFKNLKNLTLGQTLELMSEIMEAKFQQNDKDDAQGNQHPTLQQHMYSFFNKKYGLKNLTVQWAMSLVNAIKTHHQHPTISLFGRILRNEVEEYFWLDQQQIVREIDEILKSIIKQKSNRLDHQIQQILFKRKTGALYLHECNSVLQSLFVEEDVGVIMDNLLKEADAEERAGHNRLENTPSKKGNKTVRYSSLVNQILERNLLNYQKRAEKFVKEFKKVDADSDGLLSESDLVSLMRRMLPKDSKELEPIIRSIGLKPGQNVSFSVIAERFFRK